MVRKTATITATTTSLLATAVGLVLTPVAAPAAVAITAQAPVVAVVGEPLVAGAAATATTSACGDRSYALERWHLAGAFVWRYNGSHAPPAVRATALSALKTGSQNAAAGHNRCGTAVRLGTAQSYAGTTTKVAQVSSTGRCTGNDGVNTVSWGKLPSGYLAYTCVYYRPDTGAVLSSDMLINTAPRWFTSKPARCSGSYDLVSVTTHERGHTAGLNHVSQTSHPAQTMTPKLSSCDTSKRLLGAGDLAGVRRLYSR